MAVMSLKCLPVGYRFSPTDEELINHYLKLKIEGDDSRVEAIPEVDVCKWEPWDLPSLSVIKNHDPEWFFFCPRDQKYPKGRRSNRATEKGYWKATGKDRTIRSRSGGMKSIGMKKTLVFHIGRAPGGQRTGWIMHEYRMISEEGPYVLCRLFDKDKEESNCDEIEPTGSPPTATNSSPESMQPEKALVLATPESDIQVVETPTVFNKWSEDKSDNMTDITVPEQSYSNSCQFSDVEDHVDFRATVADGQGGGYEGIFDDPKLETLDQVVTPFHVKNSGDKPGYIDSTFTNDFDNTHNEMLFQDGLNEQDLFDLDFLEKVFNNHEDSTSQKHSGVESEPDGSNVMIQSGESVFGKDSCSASDTDNEVLQQAQVYQQGEALPWFNAPGDTNDCLQLQRAFEFNRNEGFYCDEFWNENMGLILGDPPATVNSLSIDSPAECQFGFDSVDDTNSAVGTGVKIRTRHSQNNPSSHNSAMVSHGTAPRRIRLQRRLTRRVSSFKVREATCAAKGQEAKAVDSESTGEVAGSNVLQSLSVEDSEDSNDISREMETKLRLRPRSRGNATCGECPNTLSGKLYFIQPFSYPLRYMVFGVLAMVLVVGLSLVMLGSV